MKKTYKTFYTVTFKTWGCDFLKTAYFDDRQKAIEFSRQDYHDNVITHVLSNLKKIEIFEDLVLDTELDFYLATLG